MKDFLLNKDLDKPLYIQLYEKLKDMIDNNSFDKDKLPSIRSLSKKLGVNNVTVINAYKLLEQEGYVYSLEGSGTYIKKLPIGEEISYGDDEDIDLMLSGILPISKKSINFASVSPTPDLFPIKEFKQALVEVLDRDEGLAFLYPEINGYGPLRESITKFIMENYNKSTSMDQIIITSGGQQGLDLISKSLINQGDTIILENPTYSAAYAAFKSRGAKIIGIPMMDDGIDIDTLISCIKRCKPKFIYIMTNYQSPTTNSYSQEKKKELLRLAKEYDFYIIEDDFLTDLYFDNDIKTPLLSLDKVDKVIYIKSFSKIFMPGVRIGFVSLPNKLMKGIIKAKHTTDISSSGFLQRAFDLYLRKGFWREHIEKIREVYSNKYNIMIEQLNFLKKFDIEFSKPNGGLSLWLKLPENMDALEIYNKCSEQNLSIVPGKVFFIDDTSYNNYLRLSFGAVSNDEIIEGLKILENILSKPSKENNNEYLPFI
jgi:DNA-binding transcriptional MocR family regulator